MSYSRRISLQHAITSNIKRLAEANTTYKQNVVMVNTYVNNVLNSALPTVSPQPADWDQYCQAWEIASATAMKWVNQCMAKLLEVPSDVDGVDVTINKLLSTMIEQAVSLIDTPDDATTAAFLKKNLNNLSSQLALEETFITGTLDALQNFSDALPAMAKKLQTLSNLAIQDNKADRNKINELQDEVNKLQKDINDLTAPIVVMAITAGIALTLGIVTSIVAFPLGLLSWFALGPVVFAASYTITLDAIQIGVDQDKIKELQSQMNDLTAACSVLATMSTTYTNLADQSATIQAALKSVLTEWQIMSADIATALADITDAISETGQTHFQAVLTDLQDAQREWALVDAQAKSLVVEMEVNDAPLTIGMTADQVSAAMKTGTTMDVIAYFNKVKSAGTTARPDEARAIVLAAP